MSVIWSEQIDSILSCGISLDCVGIKNWALERDDALCAINELEALEVPILGGDVCQLIDGAIELTYDNWYCDQEPGELDSEFLKRSSDRARRYICNYSMGKPLFVIVPKA
ncbi:Imm40 family immunity protein [Pseudomonas lopnurensis]|uniref:Imm40 family immunity protein n=1 Tax=Pseudomonas lopnurensis TaxID=1477517 RepID=UPI0028AF4669|nr:Imm40 family immunity protein [Pseudomonas lopnurensis]